MVYTSDYALEYPEDATISNVLLDYNIGGRSPESPAIIEGLTGEVVYTYSSLRLGVRRLATYLQQNFGIRRGTVVSILAFNTVHYPIYVHAILAFGGVVSGLNPLHLPQELAHAISIAQPKLVLVGDGLLSSLQAALKSTTAKPIISQLSTTGSKIDASSIDVLNITRNGNADFFPPSYAEGEIAKELAFICFSSGTSGLPKGVKLSHGNIVSNVYMHSIYLADMFTSSTVFAMVVPFFHILGLQGFTCLYLLNGAPIVVFPKFELPSLLVSIKRDKVSHLNVVPPIALQLLNNPLASSGDYSSLKCLMNAAAPLEQSLTDQLCKKLKCRLTQWYGLTEASPSVISQTENQVHVRNTVGKILPGISVKILDEDLKELEHGVPGELCIRGPNVMQGYVGNKELTADTIMSDGFLRTGDIGYVDDAGFVFLVDRLKEMIKVKGNQVAPAELEGVLRLHPQVDDAAVCGHYIPEQATDVPIAFITTQAPKDEHPNLFADVIQFVRQRVSSYKRIHEVRVVKEIPRNAGGKIVRRQLPGRSFPTFVDRLNGVAKL
ncbi:4-coumarate-CoA ligase [Cadophora sp. MPI-SDFR-AT-0126]|nr:4-coumarate-CoA ligase [Leotiomycetes sp. MPI-SDFR-AT-0126]